MHVRAWLHETKAYVSGGTQDNYFFLVLTKTGTAMAVPAVVAATALHWPDGGMSTSTRAVEFVLTTHCHH